MRDCKKLEEQVTPYVDGELNAAEREDIDAHLRVCPPCHARVVVEQSVRDLLAGRKDILKRDSAPASLRMRCAAARQGSAPGGARAASIGPRLARFKPLALAASLVLLVGGAFLYGVTDRSNRIMAAELVADHVKCFGVSDLMHTRQTAAAVESSMASGFGWHVQFPAYVQQLGLELVAARPCLYGEGRMAHVLYRHNGQPVSIFMLPGTVRPSQIVEIMGHEAAIWPEGDRTFVVITREPRDEVARIASFVHAALR